MLAAQQTFEIRPILSEDLAALASLFNGGSNAPPALLPANLQKRLTAVSLLRLLALHDGRIIGQASLMRDAEPATARITVLVHQDHRRRGLALALLARLAEDAGALGLRVLLALVEKDNLPAQRLYIACGYERYALQAPHDTLVFRRNLASVEAA